MTCSRCGSDTPNPSCHVCWQEGEEERDAFAARDEWEFMEDNRKDEDQ